MLRDLEYCNHIKLPTGLVLGGYSVSGKHTGFYIPELLIGLDAGVSTQSVNIKLQHILITHQHPDHVCRLTESTNWYSNKTHIFAPNINPIKHIYEAIYHVCFNDKISFEQMQKTGKVNVLINEVYVGSTISFLSNDKKIKLEIFPCYHGNDVPCVGYGITTFNENIGTPHLIYFGDTDIRALTLTDEWKKYKCVIIECSKFVNQKSENHISWQEIYPIILANKSILFILIHISEKEKMEQISEIITNFKSTNKIDNVMIWNN